jgi:hypothetical protein
MDKLIKATSGKDKKEKESSLGRLIALSVSPFLRHILLTTSALKIGLSALGSISMPGVLDLVVKPGYAASSCVHAGRDTIESFL